MAKRRKHINYLRGKTLQAIRDRMEGKVKSYKTPWDKINKQLINGIDWGSIVVIAAESGVGKTSISDQIIHEGPFFNPDINVCALKFQMEMTDEQTGVRELSARFGYSIQQLYSADENFTVTEEGLIQEIRDFYNSNNKVAIEQVSGTLTAEEIEEEIMDYYAETQLPMIIYIDHAALTAKGADEKTQKECLTSLQLMANRVKKKIPIIIIFLSQANRNLSEAHRMEQGKAANYPHKGDLYGGDDLYTCADIVMFWMRPFMKGIRRYGGEKWVIEKDHMVCHLLKNRYNPPSMLFFKENLKNFKVRECDPPPTDR